MFGKNKKASINTDYIGQGAEEIDDSDLQDLLAKEEILYDRAGSSSALKPLLNQLRLFYALLKDYWNDRYSSIEFKSIAVVAFALIYVLTPLDLVPDAIPVAGWLDDAAVVRLAIKIIGDELERYRLWAARN
jgi:uncharacterized membrane protein YkvA (DUF1232 family)